MKERLLIEMKDHWSLIKKNLRSAAQSVLNVTRNIRFLAVSHHFVKTIKSVEGRSLFLWLHGFKETMRHKKSKKL